MQNKRLFGRQLEQSEGFEGSFTNLCDNSQVVGKSILFSESDEKISQGNSNQTLNTTKQIVSNSVRIPQEDFILLEFLYNHIGILEVGCTGVLISSKHVLTAGHCITTALSFNNTNPPIRFLPGINKSLQIALQQQEIQYAEYRQYFVHPNYQQIFDPRYDVALVELKNFESDSFFSYSSDEEFCDLSKCLLANILGYREDQNFGELWLTRCDNFRYSCGQLAASHQCDTVGGMSGAPVILKDYNDTYTLLGINTQGLENEDFGRIVLLNDEVKDFIQNILESN